MSERASHETANKFSLEKEYYSLFDVVNDFDKRLITVKGWGVTISLAALATGFQSQHNGIFLVGCITGIGFWYIDGAMKRHQMRYYVRMREIEVASHNSGQAGPRIDWSWTYAPRSYSREKYVPQPPTPYSKPYFFYTFSWLSLNVAFPYLISVVGGFVLFLLASAGGLGGKMTW